MSSTTSILSLENPARDFLNANYKKEDLQKQCRELGFTKVWVTKDKLIDNDFREISIIMNSCIRK